MSWRKPTSARYSPPVTRWTRRPALSVSTRRPCTANVNSTTCELYPMKLAMKLRTRLFLSISALITVALLGLVLGLVSVMQMAKTQESLIRSNFITLDLGLKLRQTLGDQLMIMLNERPNRAALEDSKQRYFTLLQQGIDHEQKDAATSGFTQAKTNYLSFLEAFDKSEIASPQLRNNDELTERF